MQSLLLILLFIVAYCVYAQRTQANSNKLKNILLLLLLLCSLFVLFNLLFYAVNTSSPIFYNIQIVSLNIEIIWKCISSCVPFVMCMYFKLFLTAPLTYVIALLFLQPTTIQNMLSMGFLCLASEIIRKKTYVSQQRTYSMQQNTQFIVPLWIPTIARGGFLFFCNFFHCSLLPLYQMNCTSCSFPIAEDLFCFIIQFSNIYSPDRKL